MKKFTTKKSGFTLLEILLVIALIAILAGIILVALKPAQRLRETNDTQRRTDTASLLSAIYQYAIDNGGELPDDGAVDIDTSNKIIGAEAGDCSLETCDAAGSTDSNCIDLEADLVTNGGYLASMPINPGGLGTNFDSDNTGYYVTQNANGTLTVGSCEDDINSNAIETSR